MTRGQGHWGAVLLVLVAGLSGCASERPDAAPAEIDGGNFAALGILEGQVFDEELQPVEGVLVSIDGIPAAQSDADGLFRVVGVPAGSHDVTFSAGTFETILRSMAMEAGQVVSMEVSLTRIPGQEPYIEILPFRGFAACGVAAWIAADNPGYGDQIHPACTLLGLREGGLFEISLAESWRYMVTELSWQPQFGASQDAFRLAQANITSCNGNVGSLCYAVVVASYYARIEAEPGKTEVTRYYEPYGDKRAPPYPAEDNTIYITTGWAGYLRDQVGPSCYWFAWNQFKSSYMADRDPPGCFGAGYSTGIPYSMWVSVFHWAGPEDRTSCCPATAYTAQPEG